MFASLPQPARLCPSHHPKPSRRAVPAGDQPPRSRRGPTRRWSGSELRKLAAVRMAAESPDHTLQPTALVHEAYVRRVGPAAANSSPRRPKPCAASSWSPPGGRGRLKPRRAGLQFVRSSTRTSWRPRRATAGSRGPSQADPGLPVLGPDRRRAGRAVLGPRPPTSSSPGTASAPIRRAHFLQRTATRRYGVVRQVDNPKSALVLSSRLRWGIDPTTAAVTRPYLSRFSDDFCIWDEWGNYPKRAEGYQPVQGPPDSVHPFRGAPCSRTYSLPVWLMARCPITTGFLRSAVVLRVGREGRAASR